MLMSQQKIAGVSRILATALRNGASPTAIHEKLEMAISGTYSPCSGWTDQDMDVAFLIKAAAGSHLLYALQHEDGYPSRTTLYRCKKIPELCVSPQSPGEDEIKANIKTFLGSETGRKPPKDILIGQTVMIDGLALEEVPRHDLKHDCVLGLCREHTTESFKMKIETIEDLDAHKEALDKKKIHQGKDGTVLGIAPVTADENYFVSPLILSASCKAEKGNEIATWVLKFLHQYRLSPDGMALHGSAEILSTDGESSFCKMRFIIGLTNAIDQNSELGKILYQLKGFNCQTGINQLVTTCDPKHVIKRFATMIRSPAGIQIGDTQITSHHILQALTRFGKMDVDKAQQLLHPADKKNVPKAVNLLQSLFDLDDLKLDQAHLPSLVRHFERIIFLSEVLSYFLFPFIDVDMTLSEQIQSLATFEHLVTAMFQIHKTAFLTNALVADSQAIVKCITITAARLQLVDPESPYYILFEGTDRLEGVFSHARTQDHARNFDILQLAQKLSIGAEINAIFERYPELDRGHVRRNLSKACGVDHVNPKSWKGDVVLKNLDIKKEYYAGWDQANKLLCAYGFSECDFDALFSDSTKDHLRPMGDYIGYNGPDGDEEPEEDEEIALGALIPERENSGSSSNEVLTSPELEDEEFQNPLNTLEISTEGYPDERNDALIEPLPELNPTAEKNPNHYLFIGDRHIFKAELVSKTLASESARKVTIRPLRAQGVSVSEMLNCRMQTINSTSGDADDSKIKSGDIGAILVQVGNKVCLAVVEILNFRQTKTKNFNLTAIDFDDIDTKSSASTTIAVQILNLVQSADPSESGEHTVEPDYKWLWNQEYIQLQASKDGTTSQQHFAIRVPGILLYPLGPDITYDEKDRLVWSIKDSDLHEVIDHAWNALP